MWYRQCWQWVNKNACTRKTSSNLMIWMIGNVSNWSCDGFWQIPIDKKMVIWKERKHDNYDAFAEWSAGCIATLRDCGLLRFFRTPSMVSHERLLEHILRMWNPEQRYFEVGAHILTIEVEDIYFLTSLSRQGAPISLNGSRGGDITTQELINC